VNWYYADGPNSVGPFDDAAFEQLVANGTVKPETLVWYEGVTNWVPWSQARILVGVTGDQLQNGLFTTHKNAFLLDYTDRIFRKEPLGRDAVVAELNRIRAEVRSGKWQ
jgi:capsular polysaccharide biosynthesis protein